jgi:hypothetical protein
MKRVLDTLSVQQLVMKINRNLCWMFSRSGWHQGYYKGYYISTGERYETVKNYNKKSGEWFAYRGDGL